MKWWNDRWYLKNNFGSVDFYRSFGQIEGLSTREGKVLLLRDIIEDLSNAMLESMQHHDHKYSKEGKCVLN